MLIHAGAVENVRPAKVSATPVCLLMDAASGEAVPHTGVEMMSVTTRRTVRVFYNVYFKDVFRDRFNYVD